MDRWSLGIAVTFAMMVPFVWLTGMDTGVVFCRRADFERIGGYDERRLLAEDVAFLWALKRLGRSRQLRLARLTMAKAVTSTRKCEGPVRDRRSRYLGTARGFSRAWPTGDLPGRPDEPGSSWPATRRRAVPPGPPDMWLGRSPSRHEADW